MESAEGLARKEERKTPDPADMKDSLFLLLLGRVQETRSAVSDEALPVWDHL